MDNLPRNALKLLPRKIRNLLVRRPLLLRINFAAREAGLGLVKACVLRSEPTSLYYMYKGGGKTFVEIILLAWIGRGVGGRSTAGGGFGGEVLELIHRYGIRYAVVDLMDLV